MTTEPSLRARLGRHRSDTTFIVGAVSIAHFISHVYLLAYPPLFPLIGAEFGLSTAQLGLLVTAIYIPTLVLQLPLGELVDRIGAKRILVTGLVVTSLGVSLSGAAPTYWTLLAFALLSGVGQSVFHPADYAFLESVTDASNQGSAFGLHTFGGFAGFAAAPIVTGTLGIQFGWRVALPVVGLFGFVYAAVLLVLAAPVYRRQIDERDSSATDGADATIAEETATTTDETATDTAETATTTDDTATTTAENDDSGIRATLSGLVRPGLLAVFGFYLFSMMAIVAIQSFTTVFAVDLGFSDSAANSVLTAYLVGSAVGVLAGGPLADRVPFQYVIVAAFGLAAVGIWYSVVAAATASLIALVALFGLVGVLMGLALPARDKLANSFSDAGSTGKSFGFFFTGLSLGAVISPALLGVLIDVRSVFAAFVVVGGLLVVAASIVVALGLRARTRRDR